jgi:hypothetical protein
MRLKQYITEKRTRNVIVVDVQPMYASYIHFDMYEFCNFLLEQRDILYYYNGPDTVGSDTKNDIINWLHEESDYNDDLYNKLKSRNTIFYDKGYAFFRGWMDMGADPGFIKKAVRFMNENKVYDSREIEPEVWEEKFPDDWQDSYIYDNISIPDIPINVLKKFNNSYLVGGGKNECLAEVEILMSVYNIKTTKVRKFIYG